uniref:HEAT repeat-containing protein 6 n=4 Tax=Daphnia magna TaxID=35525 RepID=A0A0P5G552_9CRUS
MALLHKASNENYLSGVQNKLMLILGKKNVVSKDVTDLLDHLCTLFFDLKRKGDVSVNAQDAVSIMIDVLEIVKPEESLKVSKICQIWEQVLQLPNVILSNQTSEKLIVWTLQSVRDENSSVLADILSFLAVAVNYKEIKQAKDLKILLGPSGFVINKLNEDRQVNNLTVLILKVLCNFTYCSGEKDWSTISKDLVEACIIQFIKIQEQQLNSDPSNFNILRVLILCFYGLENIFVRFTTSTAPHLETIFGLARYYMLFGIAGQPLKYAPIRPSSLPFVELPLKCDQTKNPKVRKKRPPSKVQSKNRNQDSHSEEIGIEPHLQTKNKTWAKNSISISSSDSELSDSDVQSYQRLKETQGKVRSSALKMLSAAFKFCDQRSVMGYWSAFLPDSSQGQVYRHSLVTPILKDCSVKVRCSALVALSSLLQAIQPTLAMASYQETRTGSFIPLSHTLAETIIAVQRSLVLSVSAEQSASALIQILKCLAVAATVFPYEKLPMELVSKTIQQCTPFLDNKDPDVKVACLSVLRILLCARSANPQIVQMFKEEKTGKCWLLEHCLTLIDGQSGFPLTLESLLVIGEVTRSNIRVAQPYFQHIVRSICHKLLTDQDSGIQIRCGKALALVGASILQEMEKEDSDQFISRDEAVQLWIYIIRHGLANILQAASVPPLKAEACAALATVGSQIFECLPRELRILFVTLALGCATDGDASVRAASIRTLGFAVTFNTLNDDASFLLDSSEKILPLLLDGNLLVALNASWALGNLADTLDKDQNSLLEEMPRDFLINLIKAAVHAAQGPMKVRCNGIRALGIFVKIIPDVPSQGSETAILLDQAISVIAKQATIGNFMKNRWNACYACGNILQNIKLLTAFSHWMDKLVESLLIVFRSCANFKVRISAANAMLNVKHRELLSHHYIRIWFTLLDSLANSEHIDDFSEFQHHETMCRQICNALCKLMTLITKDDLSQLQEAVMKYYDVFSAQFSKFLKSLLPEQLELVIEASEYIRQLGQPVGSLTQSQKSAVELFQELLIIPG